MREKIGCLFWGIIGGLLCLLILNAPLFSLLSDLFFDILMFVTEFPLRIAEIAADLLLGIIDLAFGAFDLILSLLF